LRLGKASGGRVLQKTFKGTLPAGGLATVEATPDPVLRTKFSREWREDKERLGRFFAPKGPQDSARGFNPGKYPIKRFCPVRAQAHVDQSHTYRSSKRIPCLFRSARNSSWKFILRWWIPARRCM